MYIFIKPCAVHTKYSWMALGMNVYAGYILKVNYIQNKRYYTLFGYWQPEAFIILDTPELLEKYRPFAKNKGSKDF